VTLQPAWAERGSHTAGSLGVGAGVTLQAAQARVAVSLHPACGRRCSITATGLGGGRCSHTATGRGALRYRWDPPGQTLQCYCNRARGQVLRNTATGLLHCSVTATQREGVSCPLPG